MEINKLGIVKGTIDVLFKNFAITTKVNGLDQEVVIKNLAVPASIAQYDDKKIISRAPIKAGDVVSYQGKNYLINTDITKRQDYYYEGKMRHAPYTVNINASLFFPGPDYDPAKAIVATHGSYYNYATSDNGDLHRNFLVNYSFADVVTKVVGPFLRNAYIDTLASQRVYAVTQASQGDGEAKWYQSKRAVVLVMREFAYDAQALYAVFPLQRDMWQVEKIDFLVPGLIQLTCSCLTNFGDYAIQDTLSAANNPFHKKPMYALDVLNRPYVITPEPDTSLYETTGTQTPPALTITSLSYRAGRHYSGNSIAGQLKFYRGSEKNVSFYNVYFLDKNNQPIGLPIAKPLASPHTAYWANDLVTVNFSGTTISSAIYYYLNLYPIVVPTNATQIGVYAVNQIGESASCLKIPIHADPIH